MDPYETNKIIKLCSQDHEFDVNMKIVIDLTKPVCQWYTQRIHKMDLLMFVMTILIIYLKLMMKYI